MDTFKLNKIAGAVLGVLTVLLGVNVLVEELQTQSKPKKPGYEVAEKKSGGEAAGGAAAAAPSALALLASADPAKGEQSAKKCAACHSFGKGEPAKAGPNLYGVIGLKHAHMEGFGYSDAMKKTADKTWDFENMDHWLEGPKNYIQGTTMAFAGIKDPQERANVLAYLNKNSDKPLDLPKVEAKAPVAGGAAPAAGGDAAAAGGGFAAKVAAADPAKGEQAAKKCAACHSFDKGGAAKAGPNLYGIVGLKHAHMDGFSYSDAMQKTKDKTWDVENLGHWLESPKNYIPGTSMAFMGIKNEDERAALVAYLNKNSDKPADLGGAAAPAAGGDKKTEAPAAAPAGGEQKAAEAAKPAEPAKPAAPAEAAKPAEPAKPADQAAAPAAPATGGDVTKLLASADLAAGEKATEAQCGVCHSLNKGGETIAGPNLYGIVGMKHGHIADFEYSDEFKKHEQGPWDFTLLDKWLEDPMKTVPGTMMAFPGVKDAQERANIIAFLNKNSDSPAPIPGK